jgi:MarR family transcriptional regulator, organic hydroperoxide resistance regulator
MSPPAKTPVDAPAAEDEFPEFEFATAESIGHLLRQAHRTFNKVLQARIAVEHVTIGMWNYLRILWDEDGLTQRELSRRARMLESTVVPALALLERRGLVVRERDSHDRRRSFVYLTKRGRQLKNVLGPLARETNQIALQGISTEEEATLRRILGTLTENLEHRLTSPTGEVLTATPEEALRTRKAGHGKG